ncbi:uncharacterized protein LOC122047992 isoform X1 [Zingiber officinale]|uniref:uncharacterized protein LOC122047992 isoform X1 n=2 Tax=Zingiber officinale TaxID=94328 RepID=UPI001C4C2434|nr:uncharacterized protein LOC122047992 isoform X1 [Zingiber officinale]
MTSKRKILPRIRRSSFHNAPAAVYAVLYAKQKQVAPIPYSSITSKASEIPNSRSSNLMKLGNPTSVVIILDSSKASEITNSPSSNLMELGNPSSINIVAPVPDSSTTSEALEVPMSPSPNLMELGNPRCVHLADGLIIQAVAAAAAAQSPKNGANFDCLVSRELNQNPCLKSIPNHGKLYEFVAMKYDTSRSDIVSCNSCSTESSYDSSMSSESFDVQRELQEMREEHGEELSTVGDI